MITAPRILIIDDDPELLRLVALLLGRINAESILAQDGKTGLAAIDAEQKPDLLILDLMLPDIDGLEILQRVRARRDCDDMPVLILSAKADPNTIRQGLDRGADGYVTKPYLANSLLERVRVLLSTGRGQSMAE